jgi:PAS domain S-box-containing protein
MNNKVVKTKGGLLWYHWLVVACSLLLTYIAWKVSSSQVEEKLQQRFEFQSEQLLMLVSERMSRYEEALKAGVANIYAQSRETDVERWRIFSDALHLETLYPGINGIGVIYFITPENLPQFLEKERLLRPKFFIKPAHEKSEYWPITYIEPVASNIQAVGLDMAFETNRLTAAKLARNTGETQITGPIVLVQDAMKTPGFLQYVPFYHEQVENTETSRKQHFIGHVYAPFIMNKLLAGTLEQRNRQLLFSIHDGPDELYNELGSDSMSFDPDPLFSKEVSTEMYGRTWRFKFETAKTFREGASTSQPKFILLGGLIIDSMLLLLFFMLSNSHKKAVKIASNMTEELAASKEYFRHIIDSAPCGIIIVNDEGTIENINPQMELLTHYEKAELLGKNIEQLVPTRFHTEHETLRQSFTLSPAKRRMGSDVEVFCLRKSGDEFPAEISLAHFISGGEHKIIATIIDMTAHKNITNELKRSNKELNDFAYVASHDLKAPLRGIMQLSSWIEEDISEFVSSETKENLTLLRGRTARLEKLLDDLLSYSRVGRKQGQMSTIDTGELVSNVFDLFDAPAEIELNCDKNMPILKTLRTPLETIFRNLIGNAIKHHNGPKGVITITYKELEKVIVFSVEDDGPGISTAHHQQIFELFKTLKPRDEVEGSGMGLSIVKKILDNQGQTIEVISDGESGTRFNFTWPISFD